MDYQVLRVEILFFEFEQFPAQSLEALKSNAGTISRNIAKKEGYKCNLTFSLKNILTKIQLHLCRTKP
jgi:hypothetical protein